MKKVRYYVKPVDNFNKLMVVKTGNFKYCEIFQLLFWVNNEIS